MGFSDPGCYGGEIQTPNLDRLADGGLRFTQFYNTTRCWPSRACILTGYYAQQVRRDELPGLSGGMDGKRPGWARLLPELLRPLGYRSYHSGKWHVDGKVLAGGFDRSYRLEDSDRHFNPRRHLLDDRPLPPVAPDSGYYSSTAIASRAIDMLAEHQARYGGQPFFLYLAFIAPHFPLQAPAEDFALYRDRYRAGWDALRQERHARMTKLGLVNCGLSALEPNMIPAWNLTADALRGRIGPGEADRAVPWSSLTGQQRQFQPLKMAIHAAMVHRMDCEIGRVVEQLRAMRALDDTVLFFLSDNGASAEQMIRGDGHDPDAPPGSARSFLCLGPGWSSAANTPFRLHKSWVHEGGITTPLVVHWPRGIADRGGLRHNPGHLIDLAPTILDLAGGQWPATFAGQSVPPPPGKSLVPVFRRDNSVSREYLWWYHIGNRAIRVGQWKLVAPRRSPWELYDLATDRCEARNLAAQRPDKVAQLERLWTRSADEFRALATRDPPKIPIIHSTDLFHPHDDPDDHYDLASLFALKEFDIKGVVLDLGERQVGRPGRIPLEQMMHVSGRKVPYAVGLNRSLRTPDDTARDAEERFQAGIRLILDVLRNSSDKVVIHTGGSCRDVAAALNREPKLLAEKVRAVYIDIGTGPDGVQDEYNVKLDPLAYVRLLQSGLSVYWCPCFGRQGYATFYEADQARLLGPCTEPLKNYFVYCLTKSRADPIAFLDSGPHPLPTGNRNMWCTAGLLHAAGRKIYPRGSDDFVALTPNEAAKAGLADQALEVFRFVPMRASVQPQPPAADAKQPPLPKLRIELNPAQGNQFIFRATDPRYGQILASCLKNLLADLGR